jgi:hypothetical protein
MVARSRFFVASLWAALGPAGMLVLCAAVVVLFPGLVGQVVLKAGELILLGVPFAYTAVVVGTYCIGRGLYEMKMLSRTTLAIAYGGLAVSGAVFMTWWIAGETIDVARSFALLLALALAAAGSAAVVWWRMASRGVTAADLEDEPEVRMRRRQRQRKGFFRRLANKL